MYLKKDTLKFLLRPDIKVTLESDYYITMSFKLKGDKYYNKTTCHLRDLNTVVEILKERLSW